MSINLNSKASFEFLKIKGAIDALAYLLTFPRLDSILSFTHMLRLCRLVSISLCLKIISCRAIEREEPAARAENSQVAAEQEGSETGAMSSRTDTAEVAVIFQVIIAYQSSVHVASKSLSV